MDKIKQCTKCKEDYKATLDNFHKSVKGKYGLASVCKKCSSIKRKERYYKNIEHFKEYNRQYYLDNKKQCLEVRKEWREKNPDYFKQWAIENKQYKADVDKAYYNENKEEIIKYKSKWYEKNKPRIVKMRKQYKRDNKDKVKLWENKRRTMKANLKCDLTMREWEIIKSSFNYRCAYCGEETTLTQDHFIPLSKGGEFTKENIIPSCLSCNCSKNNKDFKEWYINYKGYSLDRENKINKHLALT